MLLAEANQWPSDVRAYFGDGDECHMAFHFPLMPRMFMALRQEDRHAITEILNQTPDIPETCQWALFLRNHDELTLEMVTDEERDYMYSGLRRRSADAAERRHPAPARAARREQPPPHRAAERDAVLAARARRSSTTATRSAWATTSTSAIATASARRCSGASDRNGGFSRADPARLYAPPIMDPVYGYQAINVEAQERYPFSLLNWMKRLIAMRKQHRVFGRGSLEFVGCSNRKVLAYLRRDERETILVVVNLSRTRAAGGARPEGVRRADPGRDERPDRVPAHRRSARTS